MLLFDSKLFKICQIIFLSINFLFKFIFSFFIYWFSVIWSLKFFPYSFLFFFFFWDLFFFFWVIFFYFFTFFYSFMPNLKLLVIFYFFINIITIIIPIYAGKFLWNQNGLMLQSNNIQKIFKFMLILKFIGITKTTCIFGN